MYEIAVCDDDLAFARELQALLNALLGERGADARVSLFADPSDLLSALQRGFDCDLIFLDILFDSENGVRFARLLREQDYDADLVFVTSSPEFAVAAFDARPLHYLLKPLTRDRLAQVLERFLERRTPHNLQLATPQGLLRLPVLDILFFEIYNHTIVIHLRDGREKAWRGSLGELEALLPPHCFVRTHRSFLVNLAHISEIDRTRVLLSSGGSVPISKSAYPGVLTSMIAFDQRKLRSAPD